MWWISHYIKPETVSRYFIFYPNLYKKNKQKNLRWAQMPFMNYLLKTLKKNGTLTLVTNDKEYFNESLDTFVLFWKMKLVEKKLLQILQEVFMKKKILDRKQQSFQMNLIKN